MLGRTIFLQLKTISTLLGLTYDVYTWTQVS